ncbi:EamA family transporter [Candidatus Woesearchaeota archaeon]|nr:EamA family transporter [Candidatus Woesearchaeota archaeon]
MSQGIIFAVVAAIAFAIWTVFHERASSHVNHLFGAIIVSLTAFLLGLVFLLPRIKSTTLFTDPKGILFAILAGVCALAIDYFALKAYGAGLAISVGGPIIIGGSVAIAAIIGFLLGESITLMKIVGLLFVIVGSGILARFAT